MHPKSEQSEELEEAHLRLDFGHQIRARAIESIVTKRHFCRGVAEGRKTLHRYFNCSGTSIGLFGRNFIRLLRAPFTSPKSCLTMMCVLSYKR